MLWPNWSCLRANTVLKYNRYVETTRVGIRNLKKVYLPAVATKCEMEAANCIVVV